MCQQGCPKGHRGVSFPTRDTEPGKYGWAVAIHDSAGLHLMTLTRATEEKLADREVVPGRFYNPGGPLALLGVVWPDARMVPMNSPRDVFNPVGPRAWSDVILNGPGPWGFEVHDSGGRHLFTLTEKSWITLGLYIPATVWPKIKLVILDEDDDYFHSTEDM